MWVEGEDVIGAATITAKVKIVCVVWRVVWRDKLVKLSGEGKFNAYYCSSPASVHVGPLCVG
jgi:hypothetical protein